MSHRSPVAAGHRPARHWLAPLALALGLAGPLAANAQPAAPVLKNNQVTEDALIDALEIAPPAPPEGASGATRALRPTLRPTAASKPPGPGKASLLITFATNSAELSAETIQVLEKVAKALQSDRLAGFAFRIEGHADPRGAVDANQKLSQDRAQAVVGYLTSKLGVLPDRLQSVGKGATELLNPNQPDAPENRRVTIVTTQ